MKLIVGLGNPGKKYEGTRHNSGFEVIDAFCDIAKVDCDKESFQGLFAKARLFDDEVIFFKPTTYMNLSGNAVREIVNFFKIDVDDIIVVYDDMAIKPGNIRLRVSGSSGGQKGMQSIIENLKTDKIKRIRVGIGEPEYSSVDYVLGKPKGEDKELWDKGIEKAVKALKEVLLSSFEKASCLYN